MYPMLVGRKAAFGHHALRLCKPTAVNSTRLVSSAQTNDHKVGDIIHGYKLEQVDHIKELNIRPFFLRHQATGAEHIHIHKESDDNNVFAVSLRTTPQNSTGVAHILEHLALCGSKKYAVRDPFFKMTTRSLATFMNAMTGPDFTVYPFSTQNKKDFENLLSVYTDAVFFPRLRPVDFRQEGWRLEHEKPDKEDTPIVIRGVVYNEMKGAFSSSSAIYGRQLLNNLFPDTTYRYESGGDPEKIPSLSHDELKKFHKLHYHPSNAKFFTYGDIPLEHHLKLINDMVMSKFSENSQSREQSIVSEQEPWTQPRTVEISCPNDPLSANPEKQTTTSISYMMPTTITNLEDKFALEFLSSLLLDGPNSPFYKNLIESGLGSDFSPSTGFDAYTKQPYFSVGLQNIHKEDIPKVHEIIERTFAETAEQGFSQERIDVVLHRIELGLKHIKGNFGLRIIMGQEAIMNHDGDVIDSLRINKYVEKFKSSIASDKHFWANLIKKNFISNKHKLILNMSPDENFEEHRKDREKSLLESKVASLDEAERRTVLYEGMELMKIQNSKEDPSILPCLEPSKDISKDLKCRTELKFESHNGLKVQLCPQPTNEVVYFRALTDIGDQLNTANLIDYLPLFCDVATKLGAGSYDRLALDQKIQQTTGGLGLSVLLNHSLSDFDVFKSEVQLSSFGLRRNVDNMFDIWTNVLKHIHFQESKQYLHQLIKMSAADLAEGVPMRGHVYAVLRSCAGLGQLCALNERLSGLEQVARMKDMASKESVESIASKMQAIAGIVLDPFNMRVAINAEPDAIQPTSDSFKRFIDTAQGFKETGPSASKLAEESYEKTKVEDMKFPFATHYVAKSLITVPRLHKDFPALVILSKLISSKYLLREVREKGGAYGAYARVSSSGIFSFSSYRDPNTSQTMEIFDRASEWVASSEEYTDRDIEESKLGVFQEVDKPIEPGARGMSYFVSGESDDMRQDFRRNLLAVTKKDVQKVAKKYLAQSGAGTYTI